MRRLLSDAIGVLAMAWATAVVGAAPVAIVPNPERIEVREGEFRLAADTPVVAAANDKAARNAAVVFTDLLGRTHGLRLKVRDRPAKHAIELRMTDPDPRPGSYRL